MEVATFCSTTVARFCTRTAALLWYPVFCGRNHCCYARARARAAIARCRCPSCASGLIVRSCSASIGVVAYLFSSALLIVYGCWCTQSCAVLRWGVPLVVAYYGISKHSRCCARRTTKIMVHLGVFDGQGCIVWYRSFVIRHPSCSSMPNLPALIIFILSSTVTLVVSVQC